MVIYKITKNICIQALPTLLPTLHCSTFLAHCWMLRFQWLKSSRLWLWMFMQHWHRYCPGCGWGLCVFFLPWTMKHTSIPCSYNQSKSLFTVNVLAVVLPHFAICALVTLPHNHCPQQFLILLQCLYSPCVLFCSLPCIVWLFTGTILCLSTHLCLAIGIALSFSHCFCLVVAVLPHLLPSWTTV